MTKCTATTSTSNAPRKIPVISQATVQVNVEADGHPIDLVFEGTQVPGTFHWASRPARDQTVTMTLISQARSNGLSWKQRSAT